VAKDPPSTPRSWRSDKHSISWSASGTDSIKSLVVGITDSGNACMFSRTMDGSALVLSIFSGNEKVKEYITEPGDIVSLFAWALEHYS
jgi:hypothetical protein